MDTDIDDIDYIDVFQWSMEDSSRITHCSKVFLYRDYSEGTAVRFVNKFPPELEGKVSHKVLLANWYDVVYM